MERKYAEFAATKACELLAIDSPSGYTQKAATWVKEAFEALGFAAKITTKGGVLADLGGADKDDALFLQAHTDTLGAMVAEVKANGRLKLTPLGGLRAENAGNGKRPRPHENRQDHRGYGAAVQRLSACERRIRRGQAHV